MEVSVLLFGPAAQTVGRREVVVAMADASPTCAALRVRLGEVEPKLAPLLDHCRLAVNHAFASDDQRIGPGDEVALIGLVSGG